MVELEMLMMNNNNNNNNSNNNDDDDDNNDDNDNNNNTNNMIDRHSSWTAPVLQRHDGSSMFLAPKCFFKVILDYLEDGLTNNALDVLRRRAPFEDDINVKDFYGRSLLNNAVKKHNEAFVKEMLLLDAMGVYKRRLRLDDCITVAVREMNYNLVYMLVEFAHNRRRRRNQKDEEIADIYGKLVYHCPRTKTNHLRRKEDFSLSTDGHQNNNNKDDNNINNNINDNNQVPKKANVDDKCRHCGKITVDQSSSAIKKDSRDGISADHRLRYVPTYHANLLDDDEGEENDDGKIARYQHGVRRVTSKSPSEDFPDILVKNPLLQAAIMDMANIESTEAYKTIHDIIKLLLDWGFDVPWPDVAHELKRTHARNGIIEDGGHIVDADAFRSDDPLKASKERLLIFEALCSPSLAVLTVTDVILHFFYLARELETLSMTEPELSEEYGQLVIRCRQFTTALIDQCRDSSEVEMLLKREERVDDDAVTEGGGGGGCSVASCLSSCCHTTPLYMDYPRLLLGITLKQKEFVVHPHSLQMLQSTWSFNHRKWTASNRQYFRLFFVFLIHLVLLPVTGLIQIISAAPKKEIVLHRKRREQQKREQQKREFSRSISTVSDGQLTQQRQPNQIPGRQPWMREFFTSFLWEMDKPQTRCIRQWASYCYLLGLLSFEALKTEKDLSKYGKSPDVTETIIISYLVGSTMQLIDQLRQQGRETFFHDTWNIYNLTMHLLYCVGFAIWTVSYVGAHIENDKDEYKERYKLENWSLVLWSESFFCIATMMAFLRVLQVLQLHPVWGPMQLTLIRTAKDILHFMFVLVIIIICAALGIRLLYVNYTDEWRIEEGDFGRVQCVHQGDSLVTFHKTLFTLFWHLFGYGDTNDADLVIRNKIIGKYFNETDPADLDNKALLCDPSVAQERIKEILINSTDSNVTRKEILDRGIHQPTEFMGYAIVFLYDLTAIVILLNMVVAMMNNTFGEVLGNSQSEWKFSRVMFMLRYYYRHGVTTPPPFNLIPSIATILGFLRRCFCGRPSDSYDLPQPHDNNNDENNGCCCARICCGCHCRSVGGDERSRKASVISMASDFNAILAEEQEYDELQRHLYKRYINARAELRQHDHTKLTPEVKTTLFENIARGRRGEAKRKRKSSGLTATMKMTATSPPDAGATAPKMSSTSSANPLSKATMMKFVALSDIMTDSVRERNPREEEDNDNDSNNNSNNENNTRKGNDENDAGVNLGFEDESEDDAETTAATSGAVKKWRRVQKIVMV